MKITQISVWQVNLPLSKPYYLSGGRLKFESLDSSFVRIDTDEGISGWGEACPWGHSYLPAHGLGVRAGIATLAKSIIGLDPRAISSINQVMDKTLPGHLYAKSPIDIACWDILGKVSGLPLWKLLGSQHNEAVPVNSSISTGEVDDMIADIKTASDQGYRSHSVKIGGSDPTLDIERINAISNILPPNEAVTFDVNRAWTPGIALQVLNSVENNDWIEQPCETLEQCAYVASKVANPILLDECLHTFQDHLNAWKQDACVGIKVKPNRVGGLSKAKQICDLGISLGWQMHIEDVGGSALADTAAIHLACSIPSEFRLASWLCHYHLSVDPVPNQGARNINGFATPPDVPGLGVAPIESNLGEPVAVYKDSF